MLSVVLKMRMSVVCSAKVVSGLLMCSGKCVWHQLWSSLLLTQLGFRFTRDTTVRIRAHQVCPPPPLAACRVRNIRVWKFNQPAMVLVNMGHVVPDLTASTKDRP